MPIHCCDCGRKRVNAKGMRCQICRVTAEIQKEKGIDPVKLYLPDAATEGPVELDDLSQQSLRILRRQLNLLEANQLADASGGHRNPTLEASIDRTTRSVANLLKEARALEKERADEAKNLSMEEKAELFLKFFASAPPEWQKTMIQRATQIINEERKAAG